MPALDRPLPARLLAMRAAAARAAQSADVVDVHFALYALLPILTTMARRRPLVVHFQGPWADESAISGGRRSSVAAKRAVERLVYRRAQRIVVLSDAFADIVTQRYGVDPERVEVIPPGVDLERFHPGDRTAARARFGLAPSTFVVVAARRLERRMGLDSLLDAWAELEPQLPEAQLLLAGDGPERDQLERRRLGLRRPDSVRLLGRVSDDELVALYQAADCSVLPTRALEGFGLAALESMACGTPAIVSRVGGLPSAVVDLDPTLVVAPDRVGELADRLRRAAMGDLPERDDTRRHAERFAWSKVAERHVALYREVAERRSARPPQRPRVAFVDHTALLSGAELALARMIDALDVDAHVILAEDGPLVGRLEEVGATVEVLALGESTRDLGRERVDVRRLPLRSVIDVASYSIRLARRLRALDVDLVHTNSLKAALYGGVAGRLARVPVVWSLRDRISDDYLPGPAAVLVRGLARVLPAAVVADTRTTLGTLGEPRASWTVIPSPLARPRASTSNSRPHHDALVVGMFGRIAPWKGQDVFLDAFATAFPSGPEQALVVGDALFGDDEVAYAASLHEQVQRLGIAARVHFTGHVDDVDDWYGRCDVLVHASTTPEPFGQVIVEGMAQGLAVIAANAGGPTEIITDGHDGLLVTPGDVAALAARLTELAGDPALRARLGAAARDRAADFGPDVVAERLERLYRSLT